MPSQRWRQPDHHGARGFVSGDESSIKYDEQWHKGPHGGYPGSSCAAVASARPTPPLRPIP